jgi:hypothetical protein
MAPELYELCSKLGFAPPIWHRTDAFIERIESSIDETILERERSWLRGEENRGDGVVLLTDPEAFRMVLEEAENCFKGWARSARDTHEFDTVNLLVSKIMELLVEHKPIQASMILDLTGQMWCGRNWESLPEPLHERKTALDAVLRDIGLAREQPRVWGLDRSYSLAKAAQVYVANDWMHTRWLTTLLAREMLFNLKSSLTEREKKMTRWWGTLMVAGGVLSYFPNTRILGLVLCLAGVGGIAAALWIASTQSEIERMIGEVQSGSYSGRVLAERLEWLNRFRCDVPSILTGVLGVQPAAGERKDPGCE